MDKFDNKPTNALSEFIRERRGTMSLRDFGNLCNVRHTVIDNIEKVVDFRTGKESKTTLEVLDKIAKGIGVKTTYLVALALGEKFEEDKTRPVIYTDEEVSLLNSFKKLNRMGQIKVMSYIDGLCESKEFIKEVYKKNAV